ncbi:hypothetical protein [Pseudomonas mandelii]|uniref:hypothetical protein n=1 Tax=Pseudomonas mandelii TaxID=75612 RepID=UPI00224A5244|nr:hypothetical protein [Pseudomonas mandelii]MCX2898763.1 hypothetical protein [Pseudomonas mandelii]
MKTHSFQEEITVNATVRPVYTNEVSQEYLDKLNKPPFTEEELARFNEHFLAAERQRQITTEKHPAIAVFLFALEGSQTRDGGVVQDGTATSNYHLEDGQTVQGARKGDYVIYPDGSKAQIITGAGRAYGDDALVGSLLSNGDEIINSPQGACVCVQYKGLPMPDDFLPSVNG